MTEKFGTPTAVQGPAPHDSLRALCLQIKAKNEQWRSLFDADMAQLAAELLSRVDEIIELTRAPDLAAEVERLRAQVEALREPTDAMVDAYLKANTAYWIEVDSTPPQQPDKWRNGTVKEATTVSLRAAIAASDPQRGSEPSTPQTPNPPDQGTSPKAP